MISTKSFRTNGSRFLQEQAKHLCLLNEFEFGSQSILVAASYSVCILQSPHISFYGRHKRGTVSFLWSDQLKNPQICTQHSSLLRACGLVLMPYFAIFTLSHFTKGLLNLTKCIETQLFKRLMSFKTEYWALISKIN